MSKKFVKFIGLLLVVGLLLAALPKEQVMAATPIYVDDNFDSTTPGWGTTHFASIQDGINAVDTGGIVNVAAGEYLENATSWQDITITKSLSLIGAGRDFTIVRLTEGKNVGVDVYGAGLNVTIQGLKFTDIDGYEVENYKGPGFAINFRDGSFTGLTLRDVMVEQATGRGILLNSSASYNNVVIDNCNVHHNGVWGFSVAGTTNGLTVTNSHFWGNGYLQQWNGIGFDLIGSSTNITNVQISGGSFSYNWKAGLNMAGVSGVSVRNTEAIGNGNFGISIDEYQSKSQNILIENVIASDNNLEGILIQTEKIDAIENVDIIESTVTNNNRNGIYLAYYDNGTNNPEMTDITIRRSTITGNVGKAIEVSKWNWPDPPPATPILEVFDARANWYGAPTDPSASITTANLDYMPWCYTDDCTELYVPAGGSIQSAIDVAREGDIIRIAAGTFTENPATTTAMNKSINLIGEADGSGNPLTILEGTLSLDNSLMTESNLIENIKFQQVGATDSLVLTQINGITIKNCEFVGSDNSVVEGRAIQINGGANGTDDVVVENSLFRDGYYIGIQGAVKDITVTGSEFTNLKSGLNMTSGETNLVVDETSFSVVAQGAGNDTYGIRLGSATPGSSKQLAITNSSFVVDKNGFVADPGTYHSAVILRAGVNGTTSTIHNSSILGEVVNLSAVTLDATSNWWGSASGPAAGQLHADSVGEIIVCPWLITEDALTGEYRVTNTDTSEQFCYIQDAIDDAETLDGHTITVAAGTYTEQVTINKALTLLGAGDDVTIIDGTGLSGTLFSSTGIASGTLDISGFTFKDDPTPSAAMYYLVSFSGCQDPAVINFTNNTVIGAGSVDYDWGLLAQGGTCDLNINNNTFDNIGGNSIMLELQLGPVEIGTNEFLVPDDGGPAIWSMSYGTAEEPHTVTGLHWYHDNHIYPKDNNIWSGIVIAPAWGNAWNVRQYGSYTNVLIEDNLIENFQSVGIQVEVDGENSTLNGIIQNNTLTAYPDISYSKGIRLLGSVENTSLLGNIITDGYRGIYLSGTYSQPIYPSDITIEGNSLAGNIIGYEELDTTSDQDISPNWWGSPCGPAEGYVVGNVLYSPWYTDAGMTTTGEGELGAFVFPTGSTTDSMNAIIACAAPGSTLTFEGGTYPGGLFVGPDKYDLTFELNGVTVGIGSSAFLIQGNDIVINGPGIIDGDAAEEGDTYPGIAVFGDNFILDGVELRNWNGGAVVVPNPVESLKIVNNWFHHNGAGLQVQDVPTGVITIEGNLFKVNGIGVDYVGPDMLDATYNSWGAITGPGTQAGIYVLATPFNYYELYFDMDPATTDEDIERRVAVSQTFDVVLKADAVDVYGLSFKFTYDPTKLVLNTTTFEPVWDGKCQLVGIPPVGTVEYRCNLLEPYPEFQGGAIATFNYTVIASSPESFFDIYTTDPLEINPLNPTAGAVGGVKVWVNNAGYNEPSETTRLLTDTNDGKLIIDAIANFTGFIDLEGRPNDSGALMQVFDAATSGVLKATATSESSGKYTTVYEPGMWMVVSTVDPAYTVTYYIEIDRALFLPIQQKAEELTQSPLTSLPTLLLLGGDGNDDDVIDIGDASCIGNAYGTSTNMCSGGAGANSDVNEDGIVNIYDLTLMGGNFTKTFSPWY